MTPQMHLCAFIMATGHHVASWRSADVPLENGTNFKYWANLAQIAEAGKLDAVFLYDGAAISNLPIEPMSRGDRATFFDPMTLLSALAVVTDKIGLVATSSTTYDQPYYVARRYLSLDHLSGGRAAWNMVTGVNVREALIFDPSKVQALGHKGDHFTCAGPMCVPRSPQGQPVMVQAGGSEPGLELAAETADMVYTVQSDFESGRAFYADLKGRMAKFGREPDELKIMPGVYTVIGESEQQAEDLYGELRELVDDPTAMAMLAQCLGGADLSALPPDGPVPTGLTTNAGTTHLKTMLKIAQDRNLSLGALARDVAAGGYGHWAVRGTPVQIADQLEERFFGKAADGFNLMPATLPGGLQAFINLVLPELQRRGLFRSEYTGSTLREHLGLRRPERRVAHPPRAVA